MSDSEEMDPEILALLMANEEKHRERKPLANYSGSGDSKNGGKLQNIKFSIYYRGVAETLVRRFSGDDHVSDIVQAIMDQCGVMHGKAPMDLLYLGKILKMDQLLSSLARIRGDGKLNCPIHVAFRVQGDNKDDEKELGKVTKCGTGTSYKYWFVTQGLNIAGTCKYSDCPVKNERVLHSPGMGTFNIKAMIELGEIKCPGCQTPFVCDTFYGYKCETTVEYRQKGEKGVSGIKNRVSGSDLFKFRNDDINASYLTLQFKCKK